MSKWGITLSFKAKEKFDERLKEVILIQETLPDSTLKESKIDREMEKTINRASIVMLSSHIEGYIEDVLEEFIDSIRLIGVISSNIPPILKVVLCRPGLILLENNDHNVLVKRIPQFIKKYEDLWWSAERINPEAFPEFVKDDWEIGNPWPTTIDSYLKRIGIEGFWDDTNRTINGDLYTLVQKRNLIAHGHLEATATSDDIKRYIESAEGLIELLDNKLEWHLNNIVR